MYYVYVLLSKANSDMYIGSTNNLRKRYKEHLDGKVYSTRRFKPWVIMYYEAYYSEKLSRLRESRLKHNGNARQELKKRLGLLSVKSGAR